jgi:hypothetical protein
MLETKEVKQLCLLMRRVSLCFAFARGSRGGLFKVATSNCCFALSATIQLSEKGFDDCIDSLAPLLLVCAKVCLACDLECAEQS